MSYLIAKEQFDDARRLLGPPRAENIHFAVLLDINNALANMMDALQADLEGMDRKLDAILQALRQPR